MLDKLYMLNFIYYIFIFIFIHLIVFSYGLQFKKIFLHKINVSIGEIGLLGFVSVYTLTTLIHFFSSITFNISLFFYFFGSVFLWNNLKLLNQISYKEIKPLAYIIIFTIFFSLTTSLHDDTYLYQFSTINYLQQSKIIFGIQGIYDLLAYGHGFYNIMSIFQFPFLNNSALFLVPIVFFNFFIFTCFIFFKENKNSVLNFFLIIIFLIFCFRYNRFSTFGADIAPLSIIFLLQIYVIDFFKNKNFDNFEKFVIFLLFGIFLKLYVVSAFFLLFIFIFFLKKKFFFILEKKSLKIMIVITFIGLSNNFIQSGCLFYPVSVTCFDKNIISWGVGKDVSKVRELKQRAEAKGIKSYISLSKFSENKKNYIANIEPKEYLEKFKYSYLKYVFKDPDFKKLIVIFIIIFTLFFFYKFM